MAQTNANAPDANKTRDELFERIAREELHIETLATRNRDQLDFHDVGVWGVKKALERAYLAGQESVKCV